MSRRPDPYRDAYPDAHPFNKALYEPYNPSDMEGGPSPLVARLRELPAAPAPQQETSPSSLCNGCAFSIDRGRLEGECRKVAITTTRWGVLAGAPGTEAATRWQDRAFQQAQEAAAYRAGDRADCPPRQARVGVVS